jgi:hypothetical protein
MVVRLSEKGVQIFKILVRGFVGLLALYFVMVLGLLGAAISLMGGLVIILCWLPLAYPDIIRTTFPVNGVLITNDPIITVALMVFIGIVCLLVGFVFLALAVALGKRAIHFDTRLEKYMTDKLVNSSRNRIARLEKLGELYENKIITKQEFELEKSRVIQDQPIQS